MPNPFRHMDLTTTDVEDARGGRWGAQENPRLGLRT